jgi:hypothetical protein
MLGEHGRLAVPIDFQKKSAEHVESSPKYPSAEWRFFVFAPMQWRPIGRHCMRRNSASVCDGVRRGASAPIVSPTRRFVLTIGAPPSSAPSPCVTVRSHAGQAHDSLGERSLGSVNGIALGTLREGVSAP